jgi:hypothetical protein
VLLKKFEQISRTIGSAGGRAKTEPPPSARPCPVVSFALLLGSPKSGSGKDDFKFFFGGKFFYFKHSEKQGSAKQVLIF